MSSSANGDDFSSGNVHFDYFGEFISRKDRSGEVWAAVRRRLDRYPG